LSEEYWTRRIWMTVATGNAAMAVFILIANYQLSILAASRLVAVNHAAQIQLVHSLASIGSSTFMNIGGSFARKAPAFFLTGIAVYCLPYYSGLAGSGAPASFASPIGIVLFAGGWGVLALSTATIDRAAQPAAANPH
jgi:uncharacterized membrane protein YgdD (TMEM256/DUF423 family)